MQLKKNLVKQVIYAFCFMKGIKNSAKYNVWIVLGNIIVSSTPHLFWDEVIELRVYDVEKPRGFSFWDQVSELCIYNVEKPGGFACTKFNW